MGAAKKAGLVSGFADERPGTEAWQFARGGPNLHTEVTNSIAGYNATKAQAQVASEVTQQTQKTQGTLSSNIREGLSEVLGTKGRSAKQERTRSIVLSAVDVTGSLGVWGITQLNNGVMRTGR